MRGFKTVDEYIENAADWQEELRKLREILLSTELEETVKWGAPCYTVDAKNIVGMCAFNSYFGLWFHQGALLSDPDGVLINAQEGKTKALRQWRMHTKRDIRVRAIKAFVNEAIALQRAGKEIKADRAKPIVIPPELEAGLVKNRRARAAFDKLTPGKRREYAGHVAEAKREATRVARAESIIPMILLGVGLHDKYRK